MVSQKRILLISILLLVLFVTIIVYRYENSNFNMAERLADWSDNGVSYQPERIEKLYSLAIEEEPENVKHHRSRGHFYYNDGQYHKAVLDFKRYLASSDDAYIHFMLGKSQAFAGNYADSLESLKRATELRPEDNQFWLPYALLQMIQGDMNGALESMAKEKEYGKSIWRHSYPWGVVLLCSGKEKEATDYFSKTVVISRPPKDDGSEPGESIDYFYDGNLEVKRNRSCGKQMLLDLIKEVYLGKVNSEYDDKYLQ